MVDGHGHGHAMAMAMAMAMVDGHGMAMAWPWPGHGRGKPAGRLMDLAAWLIQHSKLNQSSLSLRLQDQ